MRLSGPRTSSGRREFLKLGAQTAVVATGLGLPAPIWAQAGSHPPASPHAGLHEMPPESAPHERTFMQWPVSTRVYDPEDLLRVQTSIARIARTIARYEPVVMLCGEAHHEQAATLLGSDITLWDVPTDDLWCRDSGPTFIRQADGQAAVADLRFNGWGRKQPHRNDAQVARRVAERLGFALIPTGLVGEQGGVEHDGAGTLLAHASCWANPNRNRIGQAEIERRLLRALGGTKMIWAPGVKGRDITDFHIDALARFVAPGKVLIQLDEDVDPQDPWSLAGHQTLAILEQSTDAQGEPLQIVRLPEPKTIRSDVEDFVSSYVNYYVCNDAVIAAEFGDEDTDAEARRVLQSLYPDRTIEMIDIDPIGESGGGIHCATQQQPRI